MKVITTGAWSRSASNMLSVVQVFIFALVVLSAGVQTTARANSPASAQIAGTVMDQTGATVNGAWVVLIGAAGLEAQRSLTDQSVGRW